jgi:polar amino acid transport system substrate-binding protein
MSTIAVIRGFASATKSRTRRPGAVEARPVSIGTEVLCTASAIYGKARAASRRAESVIGCGRAVVRSFRLVLTLFLLVAATTLAPRAHAGGLERVKAQGVLRWGGDVQGGEPYASETPDGKLTGFEVDLAKKIAAILGVRDEFVQNDWTTLVPALERGTFDIVMNGLEVTPARAARVVFTRPYYLFAERLMVRRGDGSFRADLASLKGRRVGCLSSSMAFELLRANGAEPVIYEGVQEPYIDLDQGRTDAVLMDDIIAHRYGEPYASLAVVGDVQQGAYAAAARKDEADLAAAISDAILKLHQSGELRAIFRDHGIDDPREAKLGDPPPMPEIGSSQAIPPPPPFGLSQLLLFLKGAGVTLLVSTLAMAIAFPLGLLLAVARAYGPRPLQRIATAYVELYRGTPVLLQLYVLYFGLAPIVKIGAMPAAIIGLGMNYAAYEAEAHRAGIQAVPPGQLEAAYTLGMRLPLALRRIILPQALRLALPNVTSDFIALLKDSSLVSVITVVELTKQMTITAVDVRGWLMPGLACAFLYFAMSYPLSRLARRLEQSEKEAHEG